MSSWRHILLAIVGLMLFVATYQWHSERTKRIELEAQIDNLTYQLEDEFIGVLITKPPLDSLDVNIYSITITYSLEDDSEIRTITVTDTLLDSGR